MKHTSGTWDLDTDRNCYFLAGSFHRLVSHGGHKYLLIAVNEVNDTILGHLEELADKGFRILIDSGIFWLTNEHKRAHGITMNEALALDPDKIDGFDDLLAKYLAVVDRLGDRAWGFIELDQGGKANKVKTRALLESHGVTPIPVYHPLNDGWDYFDELASEYDRICVGNVVQADAYTRKRIATTLWERHRRYPDLWIHLLGFTPDSMFAGWAPDSADSSTWLGGVRWGNVSERALMTTLGSLGRGFVYDLEQPVDGPAGAHRAVAVSATTMRTLTVNWRQHMAALEHELGLVRFPPFHPTERELRPKASQA